MPADQFIGCAAIPSQSRDRIQSAHRHGRHSGVICCRQLLESRRLPFADARVDRQSTDLDPADATAAAAAADSEVLN